MNIKTFFRLIKIYWVLSKYGIDQIVLSIPLLRPLYFLSHLNPWNWFKNGNLTRGEKIRKALEELGPIFVKFGQTLSMRIDFLPDDITAELSKLQDKVVPFSGQLAKIIIEKEFSKGINELFSEFDDTPLASASIAQVHAATLWTGAEVVVKVIRPNIEQIIRQDISLLYSIARILNRYWGEAKRVHPIEIVEEFEHHLFGELDMQREAANASQLRRNFKNHSYLYIPEVFWDFTSKNILVIERVYGIPIADIEALKKANVDLKKLAEQGVEIFFTQVFRDCFFHADMHPGNLFVNPEKQNEPQYIAIDFGIVGTLNLRDQRYLAENFLAFFRRDYYRVAELHLESGWLPPHIKPDAFACAIRTVCEPIFERPLKDISFGNTLMRLFQTAREFEIQIQPQLILLQKTLLSVEALGRKLYPELDLWNTARPFLEKWMKNQICPSRLWHKVQHQIPYWIDQAPLLPKLIHDSLEIYVNQHHVQVFQKQQVSKPRARPFSIWATTLVGFILITLSGIEMNMGTDKSIYLKFHNLYPLGVSLMGLILIAYAFYLNLRRS